MQGSKSEFFQKSIKNEKVEDVKCNDKSKAILLAEVLECSNVSSHHIAAKELRRLEQENKKLLFRINLFRIKRRFKEYK